MSADQDKEFRARFEAEQAGESPEDAAFRERFQADVAAMQERLANPAIGIVGGAVAGPMIGRSIAAYTEGADKAKSQAAAARAGSPGQKWAAKTGFGEGTGETVREVSDEFKARREPIGSGKISGKIPKNEPLSIDAYQQQKAREAAEAALREREKSFGQRFMERNPRMGSTASGAANVLSKGVPPFIGRVGAGGMGGYQAVDAYNRAIQGDIPGAVVSGTGTVGALTAMNPNPKKRALGILTSALAELVNQNRDPGIIEKSVELPEVPKFAKGKSVKAGLEALAEKFGYDPKKIAKQYPEVIPPVMTTDPKTGKTFAQKQLGPEALAVQKARQAAQKEIDKGMMTNPFFDITKRQYVDPANYPLQGRTLTDQVPKKAVTREKYEALAESPEATERLLAAYRRGSPEPLAKDWYAMKQPEDKFVEELGPDAGRQAFRQRFAEPMAATTGGADPTSNLMMTAYSNYMDTAGKTLPTAAFELPFPIGGRFVSGNMEQANKYRQMGSIPIDNPKRHNFASNFMGYRDRPTIDEQMMGLFAPGKGAPEPGTYGVYEAALNKLAAKEGVNPVNFQDVAWAGAKEYKGKPMMQEINEMIYRTSRITGESPEEVLKGFIRGNKPMYGMTGLGALGAMGEDTGGVNNPE
jgi:hypothetical protein